MQETQTKEDLSISYIAAVCANAGIAYDTIRHDDNSTDGLVMKRIDLDNGRSFEAQLRIQLKCTSSISQYKDDGKCIIYKLKVKNYNDLCRLSTTPIILGVLVLPESNAQWIKWSPEELIIRGCMYWTEFSKEDESKNKESVNVKIDKNKVINEHTLLNILKKIAKGEW